MPVKNVLKVLGLTLAATLAMIFGVGQILAGRWQVEMTRTLDAGPERVAVLVRDLHSWPKWADLMLNLGSPTKQTIVGEATQVGQHIVWTGPIGTVVLELTAVEANAVGYRWTMRGPTDEQPNELSVGRIEWQADGARCAVHWREWRDMTSLVERWSAWFGAKQERIRQMEGSGLEGLAQELESPAAKATTNGK